MLEYWMNGSWGKEIPDDQLLERMKELGIDLSVEKRPDALLNIRITIDDKKIMKRRKRNTKKNDEKM